MFAGKTNSHSRSTTDHGEGVSNFTSLSIAPSTGSNAINRLACSAS